MLAKHLLLQDKDTIMKTMAKYGRRSNTRKAGAKIGEAKGARIRQ